MHHFPRNGVGERIRKACYLKAVNHGVSTPGSRSHLHPTFEGRPISRRPSVAFADYDIADSRTSYMSSFLLIFAIMEGVTSFVLPIIDVFGPPKHVEHRFYFEIFQIIQFTISILALAYLQALIAYYTGKPIIRDCERIEEAEEEEEGPDNGDQEDVWEVPRIVVCPPSTDELSIFCEPAAPAWNQTRSSVMAGTETEDMKGTLDISSGPQSNEQPRKRQSQSEPIMKHYEQERPCTPSVEPYGSQVTSSGLRNDNAHENASSPPAQTPLPIHGNALIVLTDSKTRKPVAEEFDEDEEEGERNKKTKAQWKGRSQAEEKRSDRRVMKKPIFHTARFFRNKRRRSLGRTSRPLIWGQEGINLYLRLGAVVFGFGVMILDGFSVSDQFQEENYINSCHSVLWIPKNIIHSIYIFWQTYFLFKYHRVVFNVQKFFLRFILCHMAVVNLGQWLNTVVQEVMTSSKPTTESQRVPLTALAPYRDVVKYQHAENISQLQLDVHSGNTSGIVLAENDVKCHSQASVLAHYLIPCGVEYSLIACAIFYKFFQRIGHNEQGEANEVSEQRPDRCAPDGRVYNECHRAHKGLFVGLLIFMATLVALAVFYILYNDHKVQSAVTLYQASNIILLAIGVITVFLALLRFRLLTLRKLSETNAFDDNLLLIGLLGMLLYDMFLLVPAVETRSKIGTTAYLFVAKAALEIVQSLMQVFLILEASRRCAKSQAHALNKPGRTLLTFLLVLNLAMWVVNTFELKHAENHQIHKMYYSGIAWKIITHVSLPLLIFFRFHSTVCLADIWSNAYKLHR